MDHLKSIDKTSHDEQEDIPYAQDLVASPRNVIPNIILHFSILKMISYIQSYE